MPTPHKHAELIKAWADGEEIQFKEADIWIDWRPITYASPCWHEHNEYRVKPKQPDFATIAKEAWYNAFRNLRLEVDASMFSWKAVADAVIKAYKDSL